MGKLLPRLLIPVIIKRTKVSPDKRVNAISAEERKRLVDTLKGYKLTISGLRDFNEAIITRGGVSVKEIHPSTMESKKVKNLFFVGEVLDLKEPCLVLNAVNTVITTVLAILLCIMSIFIISTALVLLLGGGGS